MKMQEYEMDFNFNSFEPPSKKCLICSKPMISARNLALHKNRLTRTAQDVEIVHHIHYGYPETGIVVCQRCHGLIHQGKIKQEVLGIKVMPDDERFEPRNVFSRISYGTEFCPFCFGLAAWFEYFENQYGYDHCYHCENGHNIIITDRPNGVGPFTLVYQPESIEKHYGELTTTIESSNPKNYLEILESRRKADTNIKEAL